MTWLPYARCSIDCSILSQPLKITKTPELKKFLKELELNTIIQKLDLVDAEATDEIQKANERDKAVIEIKTDADMQLLLNRLLAQEEAAILINPSISIAWQNDVVYRICPKKDLLDEGLNEEEVLQSLQPFETAESAR